MPPLIPIVALVLAGPAMAETTRTLRVQLSGDPGKPFAVENLAGNMRIVPWGGDAVVAVATVHAESDELAGLMRFEQVVGDKGVPTLRVRYPVGRHTTYRYGRSGDGSGLLDWFLHGNRIKYDGASVLVSGKRGVLLYADVEVQVPKTAIDALFKNRVGPLAGRGVSGRVTFDSGSGDISVEDAHGEIKADTGSGDVKAAGIEGSFVCDTGSGDCEVSSFKGESLRCDTGSGTIRIESAQARRVVADTGSGDVKVRAADIEELVADTGSGDVELSVQGTRLLRVKADTGSGSVRLRLPPDAAFEVRTSTGSGDVVSRFTDAEAIVRSKQVVGYRRGDGRIRVNVDAGSGDVVIEPAR